MNAAIKNFIKKIVPLAVIIVASNFLSLLQGKVPRSYKAFFWKLKFRLSVALASDIKNHSDEQAIVKIQNQLPNLGGIPVDPDEFTPERILASMIDVNRRSNSCSGFEGLSLNDALTFLNDYQHYSFFRLARAILKIGRIHHERADLSILELGCGGGDLFYFLKAQGINKYIGIDANTVAFQYSPYISEDQEHFRLLNLMEDIDFGYEFDLVCSFEVLEHIREEKLDTLLTTIRRHMKPSSLFIGTASLSDAVDVHLTVRGKEFWLAKFASYGIVPHPKHEYYENLLAKNNPYNWSQESSKVLVLHLTE